MSKQYHTGDKIRLPNSYGDVYATCTAVYPDCYCWLLSFDNAHFFIGKEEDQYERLMWYLSTSREYQGFMPY